MEYTHFSGRLRKQSSMQLRFVDISIIPFHTMHANMMIMVHSHNVSLI